MAYFNHAFEKAFLGTGETRSGSVPAGTFAVTKLDGSTITTTTDGGYVVTDGVPTYGLNQLKAAASSTYTNGYFGIFDARPNSATFNLTITPTDCCNVYLAGSAIYDNDKIGPLAGGYQETNKSKMINPKYVSRFYSVTPCAPQNNVIHVGSTYWTAGGGVTDFDVETSGTGYANGTYVVEPTGGTGSGATAEITVVGGEIDGVVVINPGKGYTEGDVLAVPGGTGGELLVDGVTIAHAQEGCGISTECCKEFLCGETYYLRLDVKGSPALRFLNHNAYATVDARSEERRVGKEC
jgi:hypothetical protein